MGRKKKIVEKNQNNLTYKGSITVSIVRKGKVLNTQKYHNEGKLDLFKFFSYSLSGRYAIAEALRPKYIRLYSLGSYGERIPVPNTNNPTSTTYIMYKETPTTVVKNGSVSTQFSFMVPFTQIDTSKDTNFLVLYPGANATSPLAQFIVAKGEGEQDREKLGKLFDSVPSQNDYNLFITWSMSVNN